MTSKPPSPGVAASGAWLPGRLGFADAAEVDEFVATLQRYEQGALSAHEWQAFRRLRGVYGQRQPGVQMQRVKVPQGVLGSTQLLALAGVVERCSGGRCHLTTRQNLQLYHVRLEDIEQVMRALAAVGMTTREACGNSVRNITACPLAGVDPSEVFDVTPYADALTRHLLGGPFSSTLPRKFKIAFEGCHRGCVCAPINDLAFVARRSPAGEPGFTVLAGGGLSTLPRSAGLLLPFLPAAELLALSDAVVRVFHREGDRRNKHKARLKWAIERLGWAAFRDAVLAEWEAIRKDGPPRLPFDPERPPVEPLPPCPPGLPPAPWNERTDADFQTWRRSNVRPQRQSGYAAVVVTLPLGDLDAGGLRGLAELCAAAGDGTVRATPDQNLVLRYVPIEHLPALYLRLRALGLGEPDASSLADVVSCPGADTCTIAVTASRGMGRLVRDYLRRAPASWADTGGARVQISGCPNGCGQHHLGAIGFQGGLLKVGGRPLPVYLLTIGGGVDGGAARFGRIVGKLPARRGPAAIARLLELWRRERGEGERLERYLSRISIEHARAELAELLHIDEQALTAEDFVDLGQQEPFVVGQGQPERAA